MRKSATARGCWKREAFTLVEIALALGVAAFALVAIIGMVPVALDNARESRQQTRAAFIARTIFGDLFSGMEGKVVVQTTNAGSDSDFSLVTLEPGLAETYTLAFDEAGRLLGPAGDFVAGTGMPDGTIFTARLTLAQTADEPARAEVSVETPGIAAQANRQKYQFVSLVLR